MLQSQNRASTNSDVGCMTIDKRATVLQSQNRASTNSDSSSNRENAASIALQSQNRASTNSDVDSKIITGLPTKRCNPKIGLPQIPTQPVLCRMVAVHQLQSQNRASTNSDPHEGQGQGSHHAVLQSQNRASTNSDRKECPRHYSMFMSCNPKIGLPQIPTSLAARHIPAGLLLQSQNRASTNSDDMSLTESGTILKLQSQNRASTNSDAHRWPINPMWSRCCNPKIGLPQIPTNDSLLADSTTSRVAIPKSGFHKFRPQVLSQAEMEKIRCNPKIGLPQIPTRRLHSGRRNQFQVAIPKSGFHKFRPKAHKVFKAR